MERLPGAGGELPHRVTSPSAGERFIDPALAAIDRIATHGDAFDPTALLRAVSILHALGEADAGLALEVYGREADLGPGRAGGELDRLRPILAVRLLYAPRPGATPIRPPALGKPDVDLSADPDLAPHWPLVVSCDIPFLPIGTYFIGGAPTSAARVVEEARTRGRLRDSPPAPSCTPAEAAERLVTSEAWQALVPEAQRDYARSLVVGQAERAAASGTTISTVDDPPPRSS
jgi:hypothetical protein